MKIGLQFAMPAELHALPGAKDLEPFETVSGVPFYQVAPDIIACASGISKASGLASLAQEHGVEAADVVAFGDMPNDLPMLRWAGTSVAVANAHPDVLAEAGSVTTSNDEDGVAAVIEQLLAGSG